ncbi:MAG TPA: hypothetical protein VN577_18415 [Terriglobales bacterium]|nr:hypothetical protein [Terriglobales bacterium]
MLYFTDPLTNSDLGVVLAWPDVSSGYYLYTRDWDDQGTYNNIGGTGPVPTTFYSKLTTITNGQIASEVNLQLDPAYQGVAPQSVLQREDGSYIATFNHGRNLLAFNTAGEVLWSRITPVETEAQYVLADGGVIYKEGGSTPQLVTIDAQGNEVSRVLDNGIRFSWKGAYKPGSTMFIETGSTGDRGPSRA